MKYVFAAILVWVAFTAAALADQSIVDVQRALKGQGFYYGEINGQKDADTTAAIRRYQIRNGLQITGDLNDETLKAIMSASANSAPQSPAASGSNRPPPASAGDDEASNLRADAAPPTRPLNPPSIQPGRPSDTDQFPERPNGERPVPPGNGLFSGTPYETAPIEMQRKVIADAQRILARRGLFRDEVNGAYGPSLEFSLRAYQSRVGLPASGRLDLETLAALQLLPGAHTPIFTPRRRIPSSEAPVRGEWVRP